MTRAPATDVLDDLAHGWKVYKRTELHDDIQRAFNDIADEKEASGIIDPDAGEVIIDDDDVAEVRYQFDLDADDETIAQVIGYGYIEVNDLRFDAPPPPPPRRQAIRPHRRPTRRPRQRRSHRTGAALCKTAAGDSGDPDPEPPGNRRGPSSRAASIEISTEHATNLAHRSALVDLLADLIGGGR